MSLMRYYTCYLWILFIAAFASIILGVIFKLAGVYVFGLAPLAYLRFSAVCLLFAIALSLAQMTLGKKE